MDLHAAHVVTAVLPLIRYLRRERPDILFSHLDHVNVGTLFARRLAGVPTRVIPVVHITHSQAQAHRRRSLRGPVLRVAIRRLYPQANKIVAVSRGAADDMIRMTGVPEDLVRVIYNPVITPRLKQLAEERPSHPWLATESPPLILGIGRAHGTEEFCNIASGDGHLAGTM